MPVDLSKKTWLADLVDGELSRYDPAAALLRLPPELRGADPEGPSLEARARALLVRSLRIPAPAETPAAAAAEDAEQAAFLAPVRGDVGLALDLALVLRAAGAFAPPAPGLPGPAGLHRPSFDLDRRRAELAALFAALTGALDLARDADPGRSGGGAAAAVRKAFARAGAVRKARGWPAGDPPDGLPLRAGLVVLERRHLARLAIAMHGEGRLDLAAAKKLRSAATGDAVLLAEALAGLAAAPAPLDPRRRRVALRQVARLRLPRDAARSARVAVLEPRPAPELARAVPVRLRAFLVEQLLLSELASAQSAPARAAYVQAFVAEAGIPAEQVAALQADAADLYAGQQRWLAPGEAAAWGGGSEAWDGGVADEVMEKVAAAVTENLEAIVTEVKQTGELGALLAKAAAGTRLSAEEKRKVKEQLVDLAKAVPALALFAAPGGMLLLPVLAKLLPFSVLPSAWEKDRTKQGGKKP